MENPKTFIVTTVLTAVCLSNAISATRVAEGITWFSAFLGSALVTSSQSKKVKVKDLKDGFLDLSEDLFAGLSQMVPERELRSAALTVIPRPFVSALQSMEAIASDTSWVQPFLRRSRLVIGASGSGKTTWMLYETFLAVERGEELVICDMDYGSAHEGSQPNRWLGMPVDAVRYTVQDIYQTVVEYSALVDLRAAAGARGDYSDLNKLTLILDEFPSVRRRVESEMGKDPLLTFDNALRNLLSRGLKQRITFIAGTQNPDVASTGIKLTDLNQTNILFLGNFTTDRRVLSLYGSKEDAEHCSESATTLASLGRVGVIKMDGVSKAVLMPDIYPSEMVIEVPAQEPETEPVDLVAVWLDSVRDDVLKLKEAGVSLTKVAQTYKESATVRNNNPFYVALKKFYNEAHV